MAATVLSPPTDGDVETRTAISQNTPGTNGLQPTDPQMVQLPPSRAPSLNRVARVAPPNATPDTEGARQRREPRERERGSTINANRENRESSRDNRDAQNGTRNGREREKLRVLGEWTMTKTLGAGSMGKVKLGVSNLTGEKVAIKVISRFNSATQRPHSTKTASGTVTEPSASFLAKAAAKDASKEIRTMREGSICLLLHHPYICGMRSMVLYPNHYYMISEYVNGGQMLDFIINHGRLRERHARKFARQIGSALAYCHANSIVHRDLKIENILISKTGNIKIIDFGLSNLYSPSSHLSTFCGSLYFAAPELLNAKPYTGPEVDVWSFGIVLFVLVCGKVPFDDQSMPALHAKIKRGHVEYPGWLSAECKHLLSRMLVTNPLQRSSLNEVLNHAWMSKGSTGPPTSHLPNRTPLRAEDISREIIKGMVGFEFGTEIEIEAKILTILESDMYRAAVKNWELKRAMRMNGEDAERLGSRLDGKDGRGSMITRSPTNKRFSGIGFYSKKLAGAFNSSKDDPEGLQSSNPKFDNLDPTQGFHPLLSIYYLVKEKIERERVYGPGVFASSTLSLTGPPPPPAPVSAYREGTITPRAPEATRPTTLEAAAAAAAARNKQSENETEQLADGFQTPTKPAPQSMLMTPQPRPRATNADFPNLPSSLPARTSFHSHRASYYEGMTSPGSIKSSDPANNASPTSRKTLNETGSVNEDVPLPSTPSGFVRRFGSLLVRPDSTFKSHQKRASMSATAAYTKPGTGNGASKTTIAPLPLVEELANRPSTGSDVPLPSPPEGQGVTRSSTLGDLSPSRHQRGVSMGAGALMNNTTGTPSTQTRRRQISLGSKPSRFKQVEKIDNSKEQEVINELPQQELGLPPPNPEVSGPEQAKPVWMKGLFSVASTSTKPFPVLRGDLIEVFGRLGVQYREIKSGFECAHIPSIDLSTVGSPKKKDPSRSETIRKKASHMLLSPRKEGHSGTTEDSQVSLGTSAPSLAGNGDSTLFTDIPGTHHDAEARKAHDGNSELVVRFDVSIVRMPLLPGILGIKFHRTSGQAWQYTQLAKKVLQELGRIDSTRK